MSFNHKLFAGSIAALVTPMGQDGEIDFNCLRELVDWHISSGTHGLVIMGTTGESSLVTHEEHFAVVKAVIDCADKRIPIIAGCGSAATNGSIKLVKALNCLKPDAFLCVTPYYVKPSQQGLIAHFEAVANHCESPLLLYNVPGRTGCDLDNDSVITLARHQNIIGIKDAVGDIERFKALLSRLGDSFIYLSGDDETALDFVNSGGDGVISVTANVVPRQMSHWCTMALEANHCAEARSSFDKLMPLHKNLFIEGNPIPVKWVLSQLSKIPTGIRLPLTEPSEQSRKIITEVMDKMSRQQSLE